MSVLNRYSSHSILIASKNPEWLLEAVKIPASNIAIDPVWSDGKKHYTILRSPRRLTMHELKLMKEILNGDTKR